MFKSIPLTVDTLAESVLVTMSSAAKHIMLQLSLLTICDHFEIYYMRVKLISFHFIIVYSHAYIPAELWYLAMLYIFKKVCLVEH